MNGIQPVPLSTDTIFRSGNRSSIPEQMMLHDYSGVADEQEGSADGELGVVVVGFPRVGAEIVHRRQAGPDVEVHRHRQ